MEPTKKQIIVLHRGWVVVGDCRWDGNTVVIENGKVVRRWGTQNGLPELAMKGPRPNTILDGSVVMSVPVLGVVVAMDCDEEAWS